MNVRALLHSLAVAAFAVAGGTVEFGLSDAVSHYVVGAASLIGIVITTYLASTSTGENAASTTPTVRQANRRVHHAPPN